MEPFCKWFYSKTNNNYSFINRAEAGNPKENLTNAEGKNYSVLHQTNYQSQRPEFLKLTIGEPLPIAKYLLPYWWKAAQQIKLTISKKRWYNGTNRLKSKLKISFSISKWLFKIQWKELDINSISKSIFITNDAELRFKRFKNLPQVLVLFNRLPRLKLLMF